MILFSLAALTLTAQAAPLTVKCDAVESPVGIEFSVPARLGDKPVMDFDYPVTVKEFSYRDGNLLLVAMDKEDPTRVRVVVSAQLDRASGEYKGQLLTDEGGHEIQLDNGPVHCREKR